MAGHALSFCSNLWSSSSSSLQQQQKQQHLKPETLGFQQRKRPRSSSSSSSSISSSSYSSLPFSNTYTNPNSFINTNNNPFTLALQTNNNPWNYQTLAPLHQDYYDYYHNNSLDFLPDRILDFSSPEDQILLASLLAEPPPVTHITDPPRVEEEIVITTTTTSNHSMAVVSPQSIAARERRRKITERTSELGKLIPGGNKMSTAEMFQAANKYVKFLQAQVSLLQLLASSNQEMKDEEQVYMKELRVLASPIIQEKLYLEEKCLVPKEFLVRTLPKNHGYGTNRNIN